MILEGALVWVCASERVYIFDGGGDGGGGCAKSKILVELELKCREK